MPAQTCDVCPAECGSVFSRVRISYLLRGGTAVSWELKPSFLDPRPYSFTLQVGQSANPDADDWADVGLPVVDAFAAVDGEQRIWGMLNWTHYRVKLETLVGTYLSEPTGLLGTLNHRDWRIASEVVRRENLRLSDKAGQLGVLLKRRVTGTQCTFCLDPQTEESLRPDCPHCWGTGFYCGYFFPIACVWAELSPRRQRIQLDGGGARGTTGDVVRSARIANPWLVAAEDAWVNIATDERYYVHAVENVKETRGVPTIANVELRLAPATDILYTLPIPQMQALVDLAMG